MPISLNKNSQIERLRNFQLNEFQYQKRYLIPMIVSNFESSDNFIMDLLLLYEPGRHHFVLIKDLLQFVCEVRKQKSEVFCSCAVTVLKFITTKLIVKSTKDLVKIMNQL